MPVLIAVFLQVSRLFPKGTGGIGPFQVQFRDSLRNGTWRNLELTTQRQYKFSNETDPVGYFRITEKPPALFSD
jgi:hypothetical protein